MPGLTGSLIKDQGAEEYVATRVAVFRDTTEQRRAASLRRQPSGYVPAAARAALMYLPKRVLLRLDARRLGAQAPAEIA